MSQTSAAFKVEGSILEEALRDSESRALLQSIGDFATNLVLHGIQVPLYSNEALKKMSTLSAKDKLLICERLQTWMTWVSPQANEIGPLEISIEKEIGYAKRALQHYGMTVSDEFWKTLTGNEVIEVYGTDGIQLYRSLSFFRYCGYSLLDISVHEWYVLWERPRKVLEQMGQVTQEILTHSTPVRKLSIPRHVMREVLTTGQTNYFKPRALLIDFQYAGSLHSPRSPEPCGIICSSTAELIAEGSEALNIEFV